MVLKLLRDLCVDTGKTVMIITHNAAIVPAVQSVIRMKSGRISEIIDNDDPRPIEEIVW